MRIKLKKTGLIKSISRGFTLVEMTISLFIVAVLSMSLCLATIETRKWSEASVYQATAVAVATSYMEQIKGMSYANLVNAAASPATVPLPTQIDDATNDYLYVGQANTKTFTINVDSVGHVKKMTMTITPTLNNLSAGLGLTAMEILMTYTWTAPDSKMAHSRAIRAVRSYIPTF